MQHLRVLWGQCICSTLGPKLVLECAHPRLWLEAGCLLGDGLTDGQCMPGRQACMNICIHLQRQPQHAHATTPTVSNHCRMPLVLLQVLAGPGRVTSRLTQHRASAGTQGEDTKSVTVVFEKRLFLRKMAPDKMPDAISTISNMTAACSAGSVSASPAWRRGACCTTTGAQHQQLG